MKKFFFLGAGIGVMVLLVMGATLYPSITGGFSGIGNASYSTNQGTMAPNFSFATTTITTNAAFTLLAPVNVNATLFESTVFRVTNSTAAAILISLPAGYKPALGTPYVTNVTYVTVSHWGKYETNAVFTPLY